MAIRCKKCTCIFICGNVTVCPLLDPPPPPHPLGIFVALNGRGKGYFLGLHITTRGYFGGKSPKRNERRDHAFVPPSLIWLLARSLLLNLTSPSKSSKVVFLIKIVFSGRGY